MKKSEVAYPFMKRCKDKARKEGYLYTFGSVHVSIFLFDSLYSCCKAIPVFLQPTAEAVNTRCWELNPGGDRLELKSKQVGPSG